jgi:lipopolysaccharide transport system permease protein
VKYETAYKEQIFYKVFRGKGEFMEQHHKIRWYAFWSMYTELLKHKELVMQFTKREVLSRYRGSFLGVLWSFLNPIIMLTVYTFVFSVVFKAKWGYSFSSNKFEFAVVLFCGLIVFNIFSEVINKAPNLIVGNANYVKKVVFPLEILPLVTLLSSLVHAVISFLILIVFASIIIGTHWLMVCILPILLLPLIMLSLGLAWFFSALGVYVRDIGYTLSLITNVLFFVTPVFYPVSAVPEYLRIFMYVNPLTIIIENVRKAVILGQNPDWSSFFAVLLVSYIIMMFGFIWFRNTRKGFADVL